MKISIIAAIGKNREMGKSNKLLWHIPEDFRRFKKLTSGHPIIMGRKTWYSLPFKPLSNRTNIIITQNAKLKMQNYISKFKTKELLIVNSLKKAFDFAKQSPGSEETFVIGGGQIFKEAMAKNLVDKLYLTIVEREFAADTFFPDYLQFRKVVFEKEGIFQGFGYKFLELER